MSSSLLELWSNLVQAAPSALALIEGADAGEFTRAAIETSAEAWIASIPNPLALAMKRVAFAQPNGKTWLSVFLGLLKLRAVPVPLDGTEPPEVQRQLAAATGSPFLWSGEKLETVPVARPTKHLPEHALVKLTSGSTGTPRALTFTHAEMIADGRAICATMGITPKDLNLTVIPLGHSYGLGNLVVPLLAQGTPLLCASAPLPQAIASDAERWKPTVFPAVPALLRVLTLSDVPAASLQSLRTVISAGAALSPEIARGFFEKFSRHVHGFYGSSETGGITYDREGTGSLSGRSVGLPLEGVRLRFARGERFWVESAAVYTSHNRVRSLDGFGKFRPADRAALNEYGELVLLGRTGRMLKIAGRRLDLTELEQTLRGLTGIRDAYLSAHPTRAEELAAAVVSDHSLEEVRALLRRSLAAWKIPRRLVVMKEFPLTARGKMDTKQLQKRLARE